MAEQENPLVTHSIGISTERVIIECAISQQQTLVLCTDVCGVDGFCDRLSIVGDVIVEPINVAIIGQQKPGRVKGLRQPFFLTL